MSRPILVIVFIFVIIFSFSLNVSAADGCEEEQSSEVCLSEFQEEPLFEDQWYLDAINLPERMDFIDYDEEVVVAILDTGVNGDHPELEDKVLSGYDFINDREGGMDDHGHGTFVAGIMASNLNGEGIAGIAQHVKILPVKISDGRGSVSTSAVEKGIDYAVEQGADIINMSFAGYKEYSIERRAVERASEAGVMLISSTGNQGEDSIGYPAAFPEVFAVGALRNLNQVNNPENLRANFSNYGPHINVSAPGQGILSLDYEGDYQKDQGTSFSTAIVSSLAALLMAKNPDWDVETVQWAIEKGSLQSDYSSGEWNEWLGYGGIDVSQSLALEASEMGEEAVSSREDPNRLQLNQLEKDHLVKSGEGNWYEVNVDESVEVYLENPSDELTIIVDIYQEDSESVWETIEIAEEERIELPEGLFDLHVYESYDRWSETPYSIGITDGEFEDGSLEIDGLSYVYENSQEIRGEVEPYTEVILDSVSGQKVVESGNDGDFAIDLPELEVGNEVNVSLEDGESAQRTVLSFYPDVRSNIDAVRYLSEEGIIQGYEDGTYRPFEEISRVQAIQIILSSLEGIEIDSTSEGEPIMGISPGEYGYDYLLTAQNKGWLADLGEDGRKALTRGEMALLLSKSHDLSGESEEEIPDVDADSELGQAVESLVANGVVKGFNDGTYRPDETIRRDHMALMIYRILKD
ncbi:S8 family peptidase [Alkalibacillus aidingensis]|uniref:S8 family peptidase n=1 Tax=Alkalibacillus aidingensis TaxID=2747607 RepID=UPI00166116EA|nr:S8 family serine peptidase [Alkalibacillus aidingensis]